jgi:hypothetical protein
MRALPSCLSRRKRRRALKIRLIPFEKKANSDFFRWCAFDFRVTLCASDNAAHNSSDLDQSPVAHDVHGRLLWAAARSLSHLHLMRIRI